MKFNKYFFSFLILVLSLKSHVSYSMAPDVFVQSTVNRASAILTKNISKEDKMNELKLIAKDTVDIKGIGLYTLGSFRKNLTESQKNEYSNLFENYFLKTFLILTFFSDVFCF